MRHLPKPTSRPATLTLRIAAMAAPLFLISACGSGSPEPTSAPDDLAETSSESELRTPTARALVAHDGGLTLIDTTTGKQLDTVQHDGFLRLNEAGDGRHVMVTDADTFRVYDTGLHSSVHGDHSHHYASTPGLSETTWPAAEGGHVVPHNGYTTLFSDGTGTALSVDSEHIADPDALTRTHTARAAHHGVALVLHDGTLLTTAGTDRERHTVEVVDGTRRLAQTTDCPGVHGEATAQPLADGSDVVVLGCENGPVVWRQGAFHKITPTEGSYQRNGNLAGHPDSPIVLGDSKTDVGAAAQDRIEHPTEVALIDTRTDSVRTVDLGSSYWFRSLGRGADGEALVLTQDGSLRVIDPASGVQTRAIEAIAPWTEPEDWQQPGPILEVAGDLAHIADPATNTLVVIDLHDGTVIARHPIPAGATELVVTTGSSTTHAH